MSLLMSEGIYLLRWSQEVGQGSRETLQNHKNKICLCHPLADKQTQTNRYSIEHTPTNRPFLSSRRRAIFVRNNTRYYVLRNSSLIETQYNGTPEKRSTSSEDEPYASSVRNLFSQI